MKSDVKEVVLDGLSVFADGTNELVGRLIWNRPDGIRNASSWLRLVKRGLDGYQETAGELDPVTENEFRFRFQLNLRPEACAHYEDVLDAYIVLRDAETETIVRLAWPQSSTPWMAYPTVYGNLSMKRNNKDVSGS